MRVPYLLGLAGAVILVLPAVMNGSPFLFDDTQAYLRRGAHAMVWVFEGSRRLLEDLHASAAGADRASAIPLPSSRSMFYSLYSWMHYQVAGLWGIALAQAFVTATVIALAMRRALGIAVPWILATFVALSLASSAGVFASYAMPDIFAPLLILSVGLLAIYRERLYTFDVVALSAVIFFAAVAHPSHLVLGLALLVLLVLVKLVHAVFFRASLPPFSVPPRTLALLGAIIALSVVANATSNAVTARYLGTEPLRLPHLSASLVNLGPGTRFLKEHCPEAGYTLCAFKDRLPVHWTRFLFDNDPERGVFGAASPQTKVALSQEQVPFFLDVLATYPVEATVGLIRNGFVQIGSFSLRHLKATSWDVTGKRFEATVREDYEASRAVVEPAFLATASAILYVAVALSALALLAFSVSLARSSRHEDRQLLMLIALVVAGILLNGVICGTLASPFDRFQARVIWLLPCLALMCVGHFATSRQRSMNAGVVLCR